MAIVDPASAHRFGALVVVGVLASLASAEVVRRDGYVPNNGNFNATFIPRMGDLYTFNCPGGGTVSAMVDTDAADESSSTSYLDPVLEIRDATGTIVASGDDEATCEYGPACGFGCPDIENVPCGAKNPHSLVIRDAGTATEFPGTQCDRGGKYQLRLEVKDSQGTSVPGKNVKLGGGPKRKVPAWLGAVSEETYYPAIDDGRVSPR